MAMAAGRGDLNTKTKWVRQNFVSRSKRISSCCPRMVLRPPDAHQVSGCKKGSSVMWRAGWGSWEQAWGLTEGWGHRGCWDVLFPQQFERVNRVLPLARFPMGGLQARSRQLETEAEGEWESVRVWDSSGKCLFHDWAIQIVLLICRCPCCQCIFQHMALRTKPKCCSLRFPWIFNLPDRCAVTESCPALTTGQR